MPRILIVDDEKGIRDAVRMILKYEGFTCSEAEDGPQALRIARDEERFDAVLCDVKMPVMDGLELLDHLREADPDLPVIMISGHGTVETAVEATRRGAYDFLEKPLERDRLLLTIRNALDRSELESKNRGLLRTVAERFRLRGSSPAMERLRQTIERVARSDVARILVVGENGTGKELVARNLHLLGPRADGPWVDVNCAAIPRELIESELFGHEKGAFTGAHEQKIGKLELAHRGTIFLDEIGDMDLEAQAKLLRVLEQSEIQRVGGKEPMPIDVRVVAATNKNLEDEVREGRFREDLFYRLNIIPIEVPPLRERGEDVLLLLDHFLAEVAQQYGEKPPALSAEQRRALVEHDWPGNVRQLRNLTERILLLGVEPALAAVRGGNGREVASRGPGGDMEALLTLDNFEEFKQRAERIYLAHKLEENAWNVKRTSEVLGMQRSNLYKKIDRYSLKEKQ